MVRIAILDDSLPRELERSGGPLAGVAVTWAGTALADLQEHCREQRPHVVIVNVDLVAVSDPARTVSDLQERSGAELVIALHSSQRREHLAELAEASHPAQEPVTLARLRNHVLSVIARHALDDGPKVPAPVIAAPPRFTAAQLARLMEISSAVDCECPNHLSELVFSLSAFEAYARRCEGKTPADAELHADLALFAAHARAVMERALERVMEHEEISL